MSSSVSKPAACILFILILSSCIQIKTSGTSGRKFKSTSLSSPLISLSDHFYPGDKPQTAKGIVQSLPASEIAALRKDLEVQLQGLEKAHTVLLKYLQAELGVTTLPASLPVGLEIEKDALATAEIRTDNTIYIDVEVLQAFFKTSIVDLSRNPGIGHRLAPAENDEDKIVQNFLEFKRDLRNTKGHTAIGEIFHDDDDWFTLVDMSEAMNKATSRYYGVLLFTMAHELGHYALGHLKEKCDANNCPRFAQRELEADRYAAAMMSALVPELPGFLAFMDFDSNRQELRGYEPFFQIGYKMARFGGMGGCSCPYPSPDERMKLAQTEQEHATKRLYDEGWIKVNYKPAKSEDAPRR